MQGFIASLFTLVEKIGYIQQAFYEHFNAYDMLLFYVGAVIICLVSTCLLPGLARARPSLFCFLAIFYGLEQAVIHYGFLAQVRTGNKINGLFARLFYC